MNIVTSLSGQKWGKLVLTPALTLACSLLFKLFMVVVMSIKLESGLGWEDVKEVSKESIINSKLRDNTYTQKWSIVWPIL